MTSLWLQVLLGTINYTFGVEQEHKSSRSKYFLGLCTHQIASPVVSVTKPNRGHNGDNIEAIIGHSWSMTENDNYA